VQNGGKKAWGISSHDLQHDLDITVLQVGLTSRQFVLFSSFSVAEDKNVKKCIRFKAQLLKDACDKSGATPNIHPIR